MIDRVAERYGVRPSELMKGTLGDLLFDIEVAIEGSKEGSNGKNKF